MGIQITPSILSADFAQPRRRGRPHPERRLGARRRHGQPLRAEPDARPARGRGAGQGDRPAARLPPDDRGPRPLGAGVRRGRGASVTFHVEAAAAPVRLARELRAQGARAGMALKPATPVEPYEDLLPELDMLLVMTVEPGFGGQTFLDLCLPKIRRARELRRQARPRRVAPGRRRGVAGDHRAVRRGRRRRVRRRLGRVSAPTTPTRWSRSCAPSAAWPHPPERGCGRGHLPGRPGAWHPWGRRANARVLWGR